MKIFLTALLVVAVAFLLLLTFALCRVASDADDEFERMANEEK